MFSRLGSPHAGVSIHAFRGEGDTLAKMRCISGCTVSIHAFRGEGDWNDFEVVVGKAVSIHAFRGEGDSGAIAYFPPM